ncbi:MAG: hypothetical protein C0501_08910 [Isosphaera sp.]|nr:hypothetical protein [Isosphaera sp.]
MRSAAFAVLVVAPTARPADPADERAAIDAVTRLGGKAVVDPKLSADARVAATFDGPTDATFFALRKLPQVGAVGVFDATRLSDKGFAVLKELPHLRKLTVEKATLAPASVAAVGQCKELRHLAFVGCGVADAELAGLKDLTKLEHLALPDNPLVTDKGLTTVKGFDRLRVLNLNKTAVTDKGLAELRSLDGLRTLSVRGSRVTGDAADKFADGMPNLRKVAW